MTLLNPAKFQWVIGLNPKHVWAYIRLGIAIYERDKDATTAEAEFLKALELAPQVKWAHYHLGEICCQEGRADEATVMYEQALEIDPDFEEAARKCLAALRDGK